MRLEQKEEIITATNTVVMWWLNKVLEKASIHHNEKTDSKKAVDFLIEIQGCFTDQDFYKKVLFFVKVLEQHIVGEYLASSRAVTLSKHGDGNSDGISSSMQAICKLSGFNSENLPDNTLMTIDFAVCMVLCSYSGQELVLFTPNRKKYITITV